MPKHAAPPQSHSWDHSCPACLLLGIPAAMPASHGRYTGRKITADSCADVASLSFGQFIVSCNLCSAKSSGGRSCVQVLVSNGAQSGHGQGPAMSAIVYKYLQMFANVCKCMQIWLLTAHLHRDVLYRHATSYTVAIHCHMKCPRCICLQRRPSSSSLCPS